MKNLLELDLNLLTALDALVAEENVSRAAARLDLSQPAMSHALRRLREAFGDPLLVRAGAGMALTPRAEALKAPLGEALARVRALFEETTFSPASSTRRFRVMMPDIVLGLIVPQLIEKAERKAPGVEIEIAAWRDPTTLEETHDIDLIVYCGPQAFPRFKRALLYADSDALAVRKGHPAGPRLKNAGTFLAARHIAVVSPGRREDMIDEWLRPLGIERRIALAVPSYLQALHAAAATDLVAFVPRRLIASAGARLGLAAVAPPLDPGIDEQFIFWPARAENDGASLWLRGLVSEIGKGLSAGKRRQLAKASR
ncbi:MAG: LysR family transcriptional regulator [Amphiplicatus sp.]